MRTFILSLILGLAAIGLGHAQTTKTQPGQPAKSQPAPAAKAPAPKAQPPKDTNLLSSVIIKQHIPATWLLDGPPTFRETILLATNGYCAIATSGVAGNVVETNQYSGSWRAKDSMVILTMTRSSDKMARLPVIATNYIVELNNKDLVVADASGLNLSHFRRLK